MCRNGQKASLSLRAAQDLCHPKKATFLQDFLSQGRIDGYIIHIAKVISALKAAPLFDFVIDGFLLTVKVFGCYLR